jgi:hypothetical protein
VAAFLRFQYHHDDRTFRQYGFEVLICILSCFTPSKVFSPSMLSVLRSAENSSNQRWRFASGIRLNAIILGYLIALLALNRYFGIPDDLPVLSIQLIGYALISLLAFSSCRRIAEVVAASSVLFLNFFFCSKPTEYVFDEFQPDIVTPPPNL